MIKRDPERLHPNTEVVSALPAGTPAPDFILHSAPDETVSLHDFRGQPVILAFYTADWSPAGSNELTLYNEMLPAIARLKAELLGISVDGEWSHLAFAQQRQLRFPLLSDFEPKGAVARAYGVYRAHEGTSAHALFVIDAEGIIRWSHVYPASVYTGIEGMLAALEQLQGVPQPEGAEMPRLAMPVSERDHIQGPATAEVTLVEYGDYECPYCAEAYPVVKEIQRQMGPRLRFVYRHFPQPHIHPHARHAAEAAEAAAAQDKFWEMHGVLFEHQAMLDDEHLVQYAADLGLDTGRFTWELQNHVYAYRVDEDTESARHSRVSGTPTFFINGIRHDDTYTLDVLLPAVRRAYVLARA
jgi:peroxiredoxin